MVGANGAGKSTLLEALRFGLFGLEPGRATPGERAIRHGASRLEVEVRIEHAGAHLRLHRSLGPDGAGAALSDLSTGALLADGEEVDRRLAGLLDLAGPERLRAVAGRLFPPAGAGVLAALAGPEPARRDFFAPLLELDGHALLAERARALAARSACELVRLEHEASGRQGDIKSFLEMTARLAAARNEAEAAEAAAARADREVERLSAEAAALEALRAESEGLALERAVAEEALRSRCAEAERARVELEQAEKAALQVQRAVAAHTRWEELEAECRALELRLGEREELRVEVSKLEARLAEERAAIDAERAACSDRLLENQGRAESILAGRDELRAELESLRARSRRAEGARNALTLAQERARILASLVAHVPSVDPDPTPDAEAIRREAEAREAAARARSAQAEAEAAELAALSARARTGDDAQARVNASREAAERLERALGEARRLLAELRPAMGACPFLLAPCQNLGGRSLIEHFEREVETADARHAAVRADLHFAEERLAEARAAARALEERRAAASPPPPPPPRGEARPRPRPRPGSRPPLSFDELGHHLSALAGVLAAVDVSGATPAEPRALIGTVAGEGQAGSVTRPELRIDAPDPAELEQVQRLADEGRATGDTPPSPAREERLAELGGRLAAGVRRIAAAVDRARGQCEAAIADAARRSRAAEEALLASSRELEALAVERARLRAQTKELSGKELKLLDIEIALTDRRVKLGGFDRLERELAARRKEQDAIRAEHERFRAHQLLAERLEERREEARRAERERLEAEARVARAADALAALRSGADPDELRRVVAERDAAHAAAGAGRAAARALADERRFLEARLAELGDVRERIDALEAARRKAGAARVAADQLAATVAALAEPLEEAARRQVSWAASRLWARLVGGGSRLVLDEAFAAGVESASGRTPFASLSRGERAAVALAFHLALLAQFPGLGPLVLDDPAAHLDAPRRAALGRVLAAPFATRPPLLEQAIVTARDDSFAVHAARVHRLPPA